MNPYMTLLAAVTLLPLGLPAQGAKKLIPDPGNKDGSTSTPYFSGYGGGRAQQITLGTALCNNTAVLFELAMRADGNTLKALKARSFSSLKLSLGYSSNTPTNMSATFASNRTGTQTLVFSGKYSLPAQNATTRPFNIRWKLAKPYIYTRTKGHLLIEYEVPVSPSKSEYFLDAHLASTSSGFSYNFGKAGNFASPEAYKLFCANDKDLQPGGKAVMVALPLTKQYPALSIWGFSRDKWGPVKLPLDMGGLGAKLNFLNVSPDLMFGMPLTAVKNGFEGRAGLPIPADKNLMGKTIYSQALFVDAKANQAGLVFSEGLAMTLLQNQSPAQLVGHYDYKQAKGWLTGAGIVFEFTGSFN